MPATFQLRYVQAAGADDKRLTRSRDAPLRPGPPLRPASDLFSSLFGSDACDQRSKSVTAAVRAQSASEQVRARLANGTSEKKSRKVKQSTSSTICNERIAHVTGRKMHERLGDAITRGLMRVVRVREAKKAAHGGAERRRGRTKTKANENEMYENHLL